MIDFQVQPCPLLRPHVQLIWCFELDQPAALAPPERIVPDGVVELVFHYRHPMALQFAGAQAAAQPRSSAITLTRRYVEIDPRGSTGFLAIRFRPWGAGPFLAVPVSELADRMVAAEDLWGPAVRELEERLAEAEGTSERVALVEGFLIDRYRPGRRPTVEPAVRVVWGRRGNLRVAELCAELGWTERSLERCFAGATGMSPKRFMRLTRFLHVCARLRGGRPCSLTRLAMDCGYYDPAHLIDDVKAFSGLTPRDLVVAPALSYLEPD